MKNAAAFLNRPLSTIRDRKGVPRGHPLLVLCVAGTLAALAGCQASGPARPEVPADSLQLLDSRALALPDSCRAQGSVVVDFVVLESGQTDEIRPSTAPECVQQALSAWVASFRYSPIRTKSSATVEWLLVEAKKGS